MLAVVAEVVAEVVRVMMTIVMRALDIGGHIAIAYGYSIKYGFSNDGCDDSSSENECNGEFDLSHFNK